jgi:hypothetical protein
MKTIKVKQAYRREVEARLRRVARAATIFLDGDDFREVVIDPALGQVCAEDPDRPHPQYHADHAKFIRLKQTLFKLKRLESDGYSLAAWRSFKGEAKSVILMDMHYVPARPGIIPVSPAMAEAFAGRVGTQELEFRGRPGLAVFSPIRDSLEDVVGVVEVYAALVPEERAGELFGIPMTERAPVLEG